MNSKERTHAALAGRPLEAKGHGNYAAILIYPQITDTDFSALADQHGLTQTRICGHLRNLWIFRAAEMF